MKTNICYAVAFAVICPDCADQLKSLCVDISRMENIRKILNRGNATEKQEYERLEIQICCAGGDWKMKRQSMQFYLDHSNICRTK